MGMNCVKCVYRLSLHGEFCPAEFDIDTGRIDGLEDYMTDKCLEVYNRFREHPVVVDNVDDTEITYGQLYDVMNMYKDAYVVIAYGTIGALVITDTNAFSVLEYNNWFFNKVIEDIRYNVFKKKAVEYATVYAPVYSLESMQGKMLACYLQDESGICHVSTRWGFVICKVDIKECKPTMEGYAHAFDNAPPLGYEWYGLCEMQGKTVYLIINTKHNFIRRLE